MTQWKFYFEHGRWVLKSFKGETEEKVWTLRCYSHHFYMDGHRQTNSWVEIAIVFLLMTPAMSHHIIPLTVSPLHL